MPQKEKELLYYAFTMMPKIYVDNDDVIAVNQIRKNFSGSGIDPNITGTWATSFGGG